MSVEGLGDIAEEPTDPSPGFGWSTFADLDGEAVDRLIAAWQSPEGQAVMGFGFRVLGGALAAPPTRPGIAGAVREAHVVSGHAMGVPGGEEAARRGFEALHAAARHRRIRSHLLHLPRPGAGYTGAYAESDVARAANVKATVDPEGRFRGNRDFS